MSDSSTLKRFPYVIYFEIRGDEILILAVAHRDAHSTGKSGNNRCKEGPHFSRRRCRMMITLPETATDADIIAAVDSWVSLLESGDYFAASESVDSPPGGIWTPELIRSCIKDHWYDAPKDHRVTLAGVGTISWSMGEMSLFRSGKRWIDANRTANRTRAGNCTTSGTI